MIPDAAQETSDQFQKGLNQVPVSSVSFADQAHVGDQVLVEPGRFDVFRLFSQGFREPRGDLVPVGKQLTRRIKRCFRVSDLGSDALVDPSVVVFC